MQERALHSSSRSGGHVYNAAPISLSARVQALLGANHASVYTLSVHCENEDFGKRTGSILEVFIFFGFGTPFYPLEADFFEPNPVGKLYSIKTGFMEYSIKKVAPTS